jgi:hypothetical protein
MKTVTITIDRRGIAVVDLHGFTRDFGDGSRESL